jgi:hypothetical protein
MNCTLIYIYRGKVIQQLRFAKEWQDHRPACLDRDEIVSLQQRFAFFNLIDFEILSPWYNFIGPFASD